MENKRQKQKIYEEEEKKYQKQLEQLKQEEYIVEINNEIDNIIKEYQERIKYINNEYNEEINNKTYNEKKQLNIEKEYIEKKQYIFKVYNDLVIKLRSKLNYSPIIDESKIVIVYHCNTNAFDNDIQLYYKKKYIFLKELDKDVKDIKYVKYVDINPKCINDKWENIDDNSKMYIWNINCPIYNSESNIINKILQESLRVLKNKGKVFFPLYEYDIVQDPNIKLFENFQEIAKENNVFTFTTESIDNLPFLIDIGGDINFNSKSIKKYYVFTKELNKIKQLKELVDNHFDRLKNL